jgi:hypothetical protein
MFTDLGRGEVSAAANGSFSCFNACDKWPLQILASDGFGSGAVPRHRGKQTFK